MNTKTDNQPTDSTEADKAAGGDCISRLVSLLHYPDGMAVLHPGQNLARDEARLVGIFLPRSTQQAGQ